MEIVPSPIHENAAARRAFTMHARSWRENKYVYPVVSRRSKGVSIGVNLNPDKVCNFDCIYCSVDRTVAPTTRTVDLGALRQELGAMLEMAQSGEIYRIDPFDKVPPELRRINDIAFSGDGEPTSFPNFSEACQAAVDLKEQAGLKDVKIVVITNATLFHQARVRAALEMLDKHEGEIWAKLDAGTEGYYRLVDRTKIRFQRVLDNLLWAAQVRPIVIQSLFMRVHGNPPPAEEIAAYVGRLGELVEHGGRIKLVQVYTVARRTTEAYATALSAEELGRIGETITTAFPAMPVEVYP